MLDDFEVRRLARQAWQKQFAADAMLELRLASSPRPAPVVVQPGRMVLPPRTGDLFPELQPLPPAKQKQQSRK